MTEKSSKKNRSTPNRLGGETSPYLLQHAFNPVDWYPWGNEALARAVQLDRPIFLSIGYSACHWCHVMEHESFENEEIARLMNEGFVNIKVDREERPDLDQIYMNAVQLMTHRGGWPMSVFLTPGLKPFYGGTYWPPEAKMGMPGFRDILNGVQDAWKNRRKEVLDGAERLTDAVVEIGLPRGTPSPLEAELIDQAAKSLRGSADRTEGGFGRAPKFPHTMDLRVLLRAWKRFGDEDALAVARLTLDKMAAGGIYDHLGGGFHRYSTDERWLVPHFEKMLYDNALLVPPYLEAYQITGHSEYARVVRETLDYVLREMTQPEGGFYSTQDADSEGVEGKFFVWSEREILEHLGEREGRVFCRCYDVTERGNWEGSNILNRRLTDAEVAHELGMQDSAVTGILERARKTLYQVRSKRIPPGRDEKVLTSWNGLMISALAQAGAVLDEVRYREAARKAADFILRAMRRSDGSLWHGYKDGKARFNAYVDDYACLIDGLVELYQATFDARYLDNATELALRMIDQFRDADGGAGGGGFFYTARDHERLIARNKDIQDNATPSGNSMAATALLRLGRISGRADFEEIGAKTLEIQAPLAADYPSAVGQMLVSTDFWLGPTWEVAIVAGDRAEETDEVLHELYRHFLPNKLVALKSANQADDEVPAVLRSLLKGKTARAGSATIYLCQHGVCGLPVTGAGGLEAALKKR